MHGSGSSLTYLGRAPLPGGPLDLKRRMLPPGILAVVASGLLTTQITLAHQVAASDVALGVRHLCAVHLTANGVVICQEPCETAVLLLSVPTGPDCRPAILSSA